MNQVKAAPRYAVRHVIFVGLVIGAFLGAISQTVALLRAPDAIAAQVMLKSKP